MLQILYLGNNLFVVVEQCTAQFGANWQMLHNNIMTMLVSHFLLWRIVAGFQIPSRPLAIGPLFLLWANQVDTKVAHIANV